MENSKGSAQNNELLKAWDSLCLIHQAVKMQLHSQGTHFFWKGSTHNQRKDWSPVWPQAFGCSQNRQPSRWGLFKPSPNHSLRCACAAGQWDLLSLSVTLDLGEYSKAELTPCSTCCPLLPPGLLGLHTTCKQRKSAHLSPWISN